jgi:hypothetical protein
MAHCRLVRTVPAIIDRSRPKAASAKHRYRQGYARLWLERSLAYFV